MSPTYLGFFCETFFCQELVKIAQSGHTDEEEVHKHLFISQSCICDKGLLANSVAI